MNKFLENTISEKVLNKKIPMSDMYSTYKTKISIALSMLIQFFLKMNF